MQRKLVVAAIAAVMVVVAGFAIADMGQASSCDGKTSSVKSAQASSCSKTSTAQASSCTKTSTASAAKMSAGQTTACSAQAKAACCPEGASASYAKAGKASCCASSARQAYYAEVKEIADPVAYRENSRVVVAGDFKCGSCDMQATSKCQAFIKTADGKMLPLYRTQSVKGMYMSKSREFEVTGRIKTEGGIKFLDVTSYKAL